MISQTSIPCSQMRGGSSKGLVFRADDLPSDSRLRDQVLVAALGSDDRQIDGVGGADPLTSKVAIVNRSLRDDADVEYLFAQVVVGKGQVDTSPNCGNMLAAVGPFAIEQRMVTPLDGRTNVRIYMVNSDRICEVVVLTPDGCVTYEGNARIDGVPGTSAPILCNYTDVSGATCGALLPTGNSSDEINGIQVTCIDGGMPVVILNAEDLGRSGYESRDQLNQDDELKSRLEVIRRLAGPLMKLGDVTDRVVPKMTLVAAPKNGGQICSRTFTPKRCHAAIGVLGAVSIATACRIEGSVAQKVASFTNDQAQSVSVEHPSGQTGVQLELETDDRTLRIKRAGLLRTARLLFRGDVLVPQQVWSKAEKHDNASE